MRAPLRRTFFMLALAALVAGGIVYAFWPQPLPVDVATIGRGSIQVTVDGEGQARVRDVYTVSAPLAGRITRVDLRAGDTVEANRTLITSLEETEPAFLDARTRARLEAQKRAAEAAIRLANAELEKARAELEFARSELRRSETLFERGTVTARGLEQARLDLSTHEARVATAEATVRIRYSELDMAQAALIEPSEGEAFTAPGRCCIPIRSPVDGRVLRVLRESETVVQAGEPLIEIGDPTDLEVVVDLPSSETVRISEGAPVIIEAWGGEEALSGRVRRIEPSAFTKVSALGIEEQRVNVVIDLDDPPEARPALGHGFRVLARVEVHAAEDVVLVPAAALFRDGRDWAVFVSEEGRARIRRVEIGANDGRIAEVRSGLAEGETVILYPSDQVSDGVRIRPRDQSMNAS
jgi:HlyD family secretion protein